MFLNRWALASLLLISANALAFDLQAHRGGRGLLPENTLAAFENAIRMGVTTLELDIAISAEGIPVIAHDPALNPAYTRDASGHWIKAHEPLFRNMTLGQIQSYDVGRLNPTHPYAREWAEQRPRDGQRIPTLASLFKLVVDLGASDIHFDMETKINPHYPANTLAPREFVERMLAVIREFGMTERVMVQSFDWRTLELLHRLEPRLRTMYLTIDAPDYSTVRDGAWTAGHLLKEHAGSVPRLVKASAGSARVIWAPNFNDLTPELLREARSLGLSVIPWTVNDRPHMQRLIDWQVDGIITDYPDRLREVMAAKGMALPRGPK